LDQCVLLEHVSGSSTTSINENSSVGSPAPTQTTITNVTSSPNTSKRKFLFGNTMKEAKKAKSDPLHCIKDEISRSLNDDNTDSMVLLKSSNNYPTLFKLAIKVLSIPATSAPVERVFSQSGFLVRQHRALMSQTLPTDYHQPRSYLRLLIRMIFYLYALIY
jgi:hypothetical protein